MNVLLLMAGDSGRFSDAGYTYPKNLVEIDGLPLVERVIRQFDEFADDDVKLICVVREAETSKFHTADVIRLLSPSAEVVSIPDLDSGAACAALLAIDLIESDEPLLIFNGDQVIEGSIRAAVEEFRERSLDAGTIVFRAVHPRWSYVKVDPRDQLVVEAAEKRPISNLATAGTYYFSTGREFVRSAMSMITKDAHVGGQFFVCPSFNESILRQARIGVHEIDRSAYHSLATPQGVHEYEEHLTGARSNRGAS